MEKVKTTTKAEAEALRAKVKADKEAGVKKAPVKKEKK